MRTKRFTTDVGEKHSTWGENWLEQALSRHRDITLFKSEMLQIVR